MGQTRIVPDDVTLFFVAGAPKAGTTTVWNMLRKHPDCHMRAIKELHYFDSLCLGLPNGRANVRKQMNALKETSGGLPADNREGAASVRDHGQWLDTFDGKTRSDEAYLRYLVAGRTTERVIGEATPAYSVLPEVDLRDLADLAPTVKILFIMRDPIERLWSHIRMSASRKAGAGHDMSDEACRITERVLAGKAPHHARLSDYCAIVGRLRSVFSPGRLMLAFFETLFTERNIAALASFLGIGAFASCGADDVSNRGVPLKMPQDLRRRVAAYLRPQYDFAKRVFGTEVPSNWSCPEVRAA